MEEVVGSIPTRSAKSLNKLDRASRYKGMHKLEIQTLFDGNTKDQDQILSLFFIAGRVKVSKGIPFPIFLEFCICGYTPNVFASAHQALIKKLIHRHSRPSGTRWRCPEFQPFALSFRNKF